jgi:hypothetical protein
MTALRASLAAAAQRFAEELATIIESARAEPVPGQAPAPAPEPEAEAAERGSATKKKPITDIDKARARRALRRKGIQV